MNERWKKVIVRTLIAAGIFLLVLSILQKKMQEPVRPHSDYPEPPLGFPKD